MPLITHRFMNERPEPDTRILIIGTFNPDTTDNKARYFYSRSRNYLWQLLPAALQEPSLKNAGKEEKQAFCRRHRIGFADLVHSVDTNEPTNYSDTHLDSRVHEWADIIALMRALPDLERVCFTRSGFSGIPRMRERVEQIRSYCAEREMVFECLITPARFWNAAKQEAWTAFFRPA